ncbi:ABC transporter permease [Lacrimispora brassicae]
MLPYLKIIKMSIQNSLQFRDHYIINLFSTVGIIPTMLIWRIILKDGSVGGYGSDAMLTYITLSMALQLFLNTSVGSDICDSIRNGSLSGFLIQPLKYLIRQFSIFIGLLFGESLPKCLIHLFMVIILVNIMDVTMAFQAGSFVLFLLLLIEGAVISFLINLSIGLLGFWLSEISTFFMLIGAVTGILSGNMIPLDILPWGLNRLLIHTPFAFMSFYPVKAGMGQTDFPLFILIEGMIWIAVLLFIATSIWNKGLRKYSAPGG